MNGFYLHFTRLLTEITSSILTKTFKKESHFLQQTYAVEQPVSNI
jgi:hypothetical protein